jgi:transcriptional regulator of heat shock response
MTPLNLPHRRDKIFEIIVSAYIETAEPVGSRTIARRFDIGLSPASIRNVMADLEEMGLIKQPHTSAGRVPTDKGYRYYVDKLMEPEDLDEKEKSKIRVELEKAKTIDAMAERVSKVISEMTENAAILYLKNLRRVSFLNDVLEQMLEVEKLTELMHVEPELFIEGAARIFEQPEFQDLKKIRSLLQAFDDKDHFLDILIRDLEEDGIHIHIGSENAAKNLDDLSLVVKDCYFQGMPIGGVAVLGPTRMKYSKIVSVVDYVADTVTEAMKKLG